MKGERFVVVGLANVRSGWFRDVGRWATAAAIPVDFVRCVSAEELRARLGGGRNFSAAIIDATTPGVDTDLVDLALSGGSAVIIVGEEVHAQSWTKVGATATLPSHFGRDQLMATLIETARPVSRVDRPRDPIRAPESSGGWAGHLIAVTGAPGMGTSTIAMALSQGLGGDPRYDGLTLLADLALEADHAMLHDARDVIPGVQELIEAHRSGSPESSEIKSFVFALPDRRYDLLLGLRRHRDWTVLRPRAVAAAIDSLLNNYRMVVADIDCDLEGEEEVGSVDVEERNLLARTAVGRSDAVLVVATPTIKGFHSIPKTLSRLLDFGVHPDRILVVLNRSARASRHRARLNATFVDLIQPLGVDLASPLHVPERKSLDSTIRDAKAMPAAMSGPVAAAAIALLERCPAYTAAPVEATPIPPGTLGSTTSQFEADDPDDFGSQEIA